MRTLQVMVVAGALALGLLAGGPAAARGWTPGDFTGYAFDTCDAPSQSAMNAWRRTSTYAGVGIYVAGKNRACDEQPHLTRTWVTRQLQKGWRLLPLVVGRQASCAPAGVYSGLISPRPENRYERARRQGRAAAGSGVRAAQRLGIPRGSVLWFDLEHFDSTRTRCRRSALAFVHGWTTRLHALDYRAGLYSSASSGIAMLERARVQHTWHRLPDFLWVAEWNGRPTLASSYIPSEGWWPHRRVHQYRGDHTERHGGVRLRVDGNFMSTGRGTVGGRPGPRCGVPVGRLRYPVLHKGDRHPAVGAARCVLRHHGYRTGRPHGRLTATMVHAVRAFQRAQPGIAATGAVDRRTWTALLSHGGRPLVKFGSGGNAVRRLQRGLNAAERAGLKVDGRFFRAELRAVRHYQRQLGLPRTGVVGGATWRALQRGRTASPPGRMTSRQLLGAVRPSNLIPFSSGAVR